MRAAVATMAILGYCYIADAGWGVSYLIRTIKACGDQSKWTVRGVFDAGKRLPFG
jgi:hypothetical protein